MSTAGPHILVYPFPTSGHIIPLLDLTHQLLTRGLTITLLVTPNNLPLLQPFLSRHPTSLHHLVLPAPQTSNSPPQNRLIANMRALRELHYPALFQWFQSHPSPPVAIFSDFFLGWTHHLASHLGLPRIVFSPSGAFSLSVNFSNWRGVPKNNDPEDMDFQISFPEIPNSPTYPWYQISQLFRSYKEGDPDSEFLKNCMLANMASWGVVFNTFAELERVYLDHVKKEVGHDRVWAVGPVLPCDDNSAEPTDRGGPSSMPCQQVLAWLNTCRDSSVIYVCFGSRIVLTSKQMDELAAALEVSGVHFVWCVRSPGDTRVDVGDYGVIPEGFEERVGKRGLVIKGWAPQVAILRHRAVGAFLTHCGWNSLLEGVVAGVVMLTWPMGADQFTNAKLLVDELGVGIRVGEGTRKIPSCSELCRVLGEALDLDEGKSERARVKALSRAALCAVQGGSSDQDLDEFVKRLGELKKVK